MASQLDEHTKRISTLEMFRAWQLGASTVIATLVASLIAYFKGEN